MLYESFLFEYPTEYNKYTLLPGTLGYFVINLAPMQSLTLSLNQLIPNPHHLPQDQSIRSWISTLIGGQSVVYSPESLNHWNLTALQKRIIQVYDSTNLSATQDLAIGLTPGSYWLNVLNLVNETNYFALNIASNI